MQAMRVVRSSSKKCIELLGLLLVLFEGGKAAQMMFLVFLDHHILLALLYSMEVRPVDSSPTYYFHTTLTMPVCLALSPARTSSLPQ